MDTRSDGGRRLAGPARAVLVAAACLLPLLAFTIASRGDWLLDYEWQDNWSYIKYFHDWNSPDPVLRDFMDHDYKGARVAWILPGFLVYRVFDSLTANLVLHFLVAAATVLLVFVIGARLFGMAAAAGAAIISSAFPGFYSSGYPHAWSYQGSICNVYYLLLLWSLAEHARHASAKRQRWWAFLAGAALTLTLLTGTTYLVALPWALAFWVVLRGRPTMREVAVSAVMVVAGGAVAVGMLSAATYLAGGSPLFMLPLVYLSMRLASESSFGEPLHTWLPRATWLAFPGIVLLGGLATTLVLAKRRTLFCAPSRTFVAAFIGFAGLWLTMIVFEATIQAYVQYEHYNFMITGPAAVALAGVLRWLPRRALSISPRRAGVLAPLLAASVLLPQALFDYGTVTALAAPVTRAVRAWYLPGMAILSVFAGGVGLLCVAWGARRAVPAAGLAFGVACAFTLAGVGPFHLSPACRDMRDNYLLVDDATRWLASEGWHVNTRSWFPPHDVLARTDGCGDFDLIWTFRAIEQAGMLWKINLSPVERIADLDQRDVRNIAEKPRPRLVIFSQPSMAETYNQQLIAWGRTSGVNPIPRRQEIRTFERGSLSITIQVYRFR